VFRSTDGGTNWNATGVTDYTGSLVADALNPNLLYANGKNERTTPMSVCWEVQRRCRLDR
jgi:hypothetical protein